MKPLFSAMLVVLLGGPAFSAPSRPPVVDRAKLFSPTAVEAANRRLAEIREKYNIDLCVDTFTTLPGEDAVKLQALKGSKDKLEFLRKTALNRADDDRVDGLYLLVTTDPRNATLVGFPIRREREEVRLEDGGGLSRTKREYELLRPFGAGLKSRSQSDHDDALLALVDHFRMAVESRVAVEPSPLPTLAAAMLVGGLVGLWLLLSLLRRMVVSPSDGGPAPPIYKPAMLGSLFGTPAGFWIYDRLFHLERTRTPAALEEPVLPLPPAGDEIKAPAPTSDAPETIVPVIEERS